MMDIYAVRPIKEKKNICVSVPGSKSITNRALMLAAMSNCVCELKGVLFSADSRAFIDCLIKLGFCVKVDEANCIVVIHGENGKIPNNNATINVESAGTAARFITVLLAVAGGNYILNSSEQMKKRPMKELLDSLAEQGVQFEFMENKDHFPFRMSSSGIGNTEITIDTTISSQYASALLMASVMNGMKVTLTGSRIHGAYIGITLQMMKQFGIEIEKIYENGSSRLGNRSIENNKNKECISYSVLPQTYGLQTYEIEPDMSAACYFYAMAIILKVKSIVKGIHINSMQGDKKFLDVLKTLGAKVTETKEGVEVDATMVTDYAGICIDMSDFSDQALTMAVVAAFATSKTVIENIGHIRNQESDRVQAIVDELRKLGCNANIVENTLNTADCLNNKNKKVDVEIIPAQLHGAEIETYDDHRVAMSFAMAGLVVDGVVIRNPMCCRKTFENYFEILSKL